MTQRAVIFPEQILTPHSPVFILPNCPSTRQTWLSNTQPLLRNRNPPPPQTANWLTLPLATTMAAIQELAERVKPEGDVKCYVDVDAGLDDASADGSESKPYKSLAYAMIANIENESATYLSRASKTGDDPAAALLWKEPAKSAVKKATSAVQAHKKKQEKKAVSDAKEDEARKARLNNLEAAKKVVIKQDSSLPEAKKMRIDDKSVELGEGDKNGARVKVFGRIDELRAQKQAVSLSLFTRD